MNILFVAAEVGPFVSVGGLSQVMYFLPNSLKKLRHDVRIFTPKYGLMDNPANNKNWKLQMEYEGLRVPVDHDYDGSEKGDKRNVLICNVKSYRRRQASPLVYFLENREYYELRANVFGYMDDHTRFALLSKGVLEWVLKLKRERGWFPDIIHCNDWHTGYVIELARRDNRYKELFRKTPLVMTIHNFKFQGNYDFRFSPDKEREDPTTPLAPLLSPDLQKQNALRRSILYADAINTVSPTHALEVLTPEYGEGLEDDLRGVRGKLIGILNGIDPHEFDPAHDPILKKRFSRKFFTAGRRENKKEIQKLFLLAEDPFRPLFVYVGRLSQQKGWDLILPFLPKFLSQHPQVQLVVLGSGDDNFQKELQSLQQSYPTQIGLHIRSDFRLPRKLFAGADILLMPSFFEPGGIVAMEAMRYGAVPVVRRTGGLNDVVVEFDPGTARGNGFSFVEKDSWALYKAVIEAITIYRQPELWKKLVRNCMGANFSWDESAKKYSQWYQSLIEEKKRSTNITHHPLYGTAVTSL